MLLLLFYELLLLLDGESSKRIIFLMQRCIFYHYVIDFRDLMGENGLTGLFILKLFCFKSIRLNRLRLYSIEGIYFCSRKGNFILTMRNRRVLVRGDFDGIYTFRSLV